VPAQTDGGAPGSRWVLAIRVGDQRLPGRGALAPPHLGDVTRRIRIGDLVLREDIRIERHFRDARAASVMAPTTDILHDFIGRAVCGLPLF
jgi:alkylation response protein AidB-like acyl-CoA dehydrogenase